VTIDRDQVDHVVDLARLKLSDEERESLRADLARILEAFEALKDVDTDDVQPISEAIPQQGVERADVAAGSLPRADVLRNAPRVQGGQIQVPPVLDET
jgi:aspartyl-tRNA(Asn)/glutamyl-tRNA(Gln) amidotransferase subunit C